MLQIVAMQLQHEQIMHNLRNSSVVEIRRALHNQSVDLARQHQTKADVVKVQAARDQALLELQELELLHSQLHIKVPCAQALPQDMCSLLSFVSVSVEALVRIVRAVFCRFCYCKAMVLSVVQPDFVAYDYLLVCVS